MTWKVFPKAVKVFKTLRNGFETTYYNHEIEIECVHVVDNRTLVLQLNSSLHDLEYRSEVGIAKTDMSAYYEDILDCSSKESQYFIRGEKIVVSYDLNTLQQKGEYRFEFTFYTALNETFSIYVFVDTEGVPKFFSTFPTFGIDYEDEQEDENFIYSFIENMPEFPGGEEALQRFIYKNLSKEFITDDIYWFHYVAVGVIIDRDGSILYPEVIRSRYPELNKEALRIVKLMPKWKPASIHGKAVKSRIVIRIEPKPRWRLE